MDAGTRLVLEGLNCTIVKTVEDNKMPDLENDTPLKVAWQIEQRIKIIAKLRLLIDELAAAKANTNAHYEKRLAMKLLRLKNEDIDEWEGQKVGKVPASIMEKLAKGMVHEERLEADLAESAYKSNLVKIKCMETEQNGFQSINRHLDST